MQKNFTSAFNEFVYLRSGDILLQIDEEKFSNKEDEAIYEELKRKLGEEDAYHLYDRISENFGLKTALAQEAAYRRGFFDGIRLVLTAVYRE